MAIIDVPIPARPNRSLKERVAIVTGAGALEGGIGIGRASAILLAEDGCSVVCVDLNGELAQETVTLIEKDGIGTGIAVTADITKADDCKRIIDLTINKYGRIDILVNNVGVTGAKGTAVEVDMAAFMKGLEINVASMVQMAKYTIPAMAKNEGQWSGCIINMSSIAGLFGGTPNIMYPTSKGAIINMTRAMAANHASDRVRVNCICPGMVFTPMMYQGEQSISQAERHARKERTLLKAEGNGWDVGAAVRFLASDLARWVTGVVLPIDGGTTVVTGLLGIKGMDDTSFDSHNTSSISDHI
ncbi:hypothetical protein F5884DRAFT_749050 [Xylogone sp. PMI_703]|nr:hypothetical protein F5884DRAFT_749050 [Xylogone sp. PMI_703]